MKQDYLFQIKEYYDKICALTGSDNPSILEYYVKQILELIAKLNNGNDKFEFDESYRSLNHTLKKEVVYVLSAYKRTLGKNAAKVRKSEYIQQLETTITQIRIDIGHLLKRNINNENT